MSGKGDSPRPLSVPATTFADRWVQTFRRPEVIDDGIEYRRVADPLAFSDNCPHSSDHEPSDQACG